MKAKTQTSANDAPLEDIKIPDIPGIKKMTPLEMNGVRFDKRHTVLTPELMSSLSAKGQDDA